MRLGAAPQGTIASQFHHFVECNWTSKSNGVSGLVQSLSSCCWFALPLVQVDELPQHGKAGVLSVLHGTGLDVKRNNRSTVQKQRPSVGRFRRGSMQVSTGTDTSAI